MNGANSYNICPRCGNSNALSSKYCSRCGGQLKVPEEPVVCHKCHTHNSPMSNFCRNCGAELKVGLQTKICPKCGKEVDAHENVCTCGYSFVTYQQTAPQTTPVVGASAAVDVRKKSKKKGKKVYNTKGGRGWAIALLILLLFFAYYIVCPPQLKSLTLRWGKLNDLDGGIAHAGISLYGGNYLYILVTALQGGTFRSIGIANTILIGMVVATVLTMIVQFVIYFVRCFTARRSKHAGWFYFAMFLLTAIIAGLFLLFNSITTSGFMKKIASAFVLPEGYKLGYAIWAIPFYYLFYFLMSLGARAKALKEKK